MDTLFIPFGTREDNGQLIEMAARWQAAYATHATNGTNEAWGTQCENKIFSPGVPVLDGVASTDTLYVLAHGQGTNLVINRPTPEGYVLDAAALALRIKLSALPSRHQRIVLSICNTNATLSEFAKSVKEEMWQLNYSGALKVYYFAASVSIPVVLETGGVGQAVLFLNPSAYVATPSGLAKTGKALDASNFMYLA